MTAQPAGGHECCSAVAGRGSGLAGLDPVLTAGRHRVRLAGEGVAATVSHMAITCALTFAPSARLAPAQHLDLVASVAPG